jgi:hypothetical protein
MASHAGGRLSSQPARGTVGDLRKCRSNCLSLRGRGTDAALIEPSMSGT